ncbi:MAG: ISKra4 family transposase [Chloroflexota bacterium]
MHPGADGQGPRGGAKRGACSRPCACGKSAAFKYYSPKVLISAVGDVSVTRRYYACRHCREKQVPWDQWAGLTESHLTPQAHRMVTLAGSSWSFDVAQDRLKELCGLRVSDETIRRVTEKTGNQAEKWVRSSPTAMGPLQKATGHVEAYTDGTCVNTRGGWREMRLSVFAKRPAGQPAMPDEWATRTLPATTARWASAGITSSAELGPQWADIVRRLGLGEGFGVSVLADGAKWIWKQVAEHLPRSECVVDIFHVSEHLHECGRGLHGDHTPQARAWADEQLLMLLRSGPMELLRSLEQLRAVQASAGTVKAIEDLIGYLKPNIDGLWYRDRLRRGLPIGSGMVEGACKTVVGRRLKCNGARWKVENADRMASLCCLLYSDHWASFWAPQAA